MRRKDVLVTSISVLTGDEIVLKELVDDLGLKEKTPLLILKVGLLRHSPGGRLLNHLFDSIRIQPIENLPEEFSVWQLVPLIIREMFLDALPVVDLRQDILYRRLRPIWDGLGWDICLSKSTLLSIQDALQENQLAFRKLR